MAQHEGYVHLLKISFEPQTNLGNKTGNCYRFTSLQENMKVKIATTRFIDTIYDSEFATITTEFDPNDNVQNRQSEEKISYDIDLFVAEYDFENIETNQNVHFLCIADSIFSIDEIEAMMEISLM